MTAGIAQFVTVKNAAGNVLKKWQSCWFDQTVDGHEFAAFNVNALISQVSAGAETLSVEIPVNQENVELVEVGLQSYYIVEVEQYQFIPPISGLPSSKQKMAAFTGEFQSAEVTDVSISLTIGANLDSTESQVPIRTFTTLLAGSPPKL